MLARQGRANEAAEAFRLAIRVHPTFAAAYQGLAILLKQSGDPRAAQLLAEAELLKKVAPQSQDLVLISILLYERSTYSTRTPGEWEHSAAAENPASIIKRANDLKVQAN